jgi:hypothetical protein
MFFFFKKKKQTHILDAMVTDLVIIGRGILWI